MQLHQLQRTHPLKGKKARVGRGGKRGTYSGHGVKGQKSRSGHRIRPASRDLIQRLPKLRGFGNLKSIKAKKLVVNLETLEKMENLKEVTPKSLEAAGLVRRADQPIKILGNGTIKKPLLFKGLEISKSAAEKIKAAGGKIITDAKDAK